MHRLLAVFILALACCPSGAASQSKSKNAGDGPDICDLFEPQVLKFADRKDYLNAVKVLADYEQAIQKLYPPPVFNHGVYQNPAHHLSIHSGFDGWKEQPKENLRVPVWLSTMGFETLLALEGAGDDQRFVVSSLDTARLARRLGQKLRRPDAITDDELVQSLRTMAANYGIIQTQQFKTFSGRRMIVSDLRGRNGAPITIAITGANGSVYRFTLFTSEAKESQDKRQFFKTIDKIRFDFKPSQTDKIQRIRSDGGANTIRESLARARSLIKIEEYGAALEQLSDVRLLLAQQMPGPTVDGDVAKFPLYNISLRNPDPQKWRLSATNQGGVGMLILEDRFSMAPSGVMAIIVNTSIMFGPEFADAIGNNNNEQAKKELLAGGGRGSIGRVTTRLESESFLLFRGTIAYQAIGLSKTPGEKVRQILSGNGDYLLTLMEMGNERDFDAKCKEFDDIIDKNLDLKSK